MSTGPPWQENTFRIGPLVGIPKLLGELGCDPDPVLERTGFSRSSLVDPESRVSYLRGSRLLMECASASGCEHFGLLLGQQANPSQLGVAGFMIRASSTVDQALKTLVENLDLHDEGGSCVLEVEPEFTRFCYRVHQPGACAVEQIYDLSAAIMYQIMRSLCGSNWTASHVLLVRSRPADPAPFNQFFRTTLFFNSEASGITFPSHILDDVPRTADRLLFHYLEQEAELLHQMQHHEVVDTLPAMLQRGLLLDKCSAPEIANAFGMNERTLHRRLQSAGTSFRQELDRVRESLSLQLLESTSLPVCDIATSLGYADSSGFIRAFRRWTGFSPTYWRKRSRLH